MGQYSVRNVQVVEEAVSRACLRGEMLILDTPYLHFEAQFACVSEGEIHVRSSLDMEEAMYGLHATRLRFRFPHGLHFLEAETKMLGFGSWNGEHTLRLAMPSTMEDDDQRATYRAEPEAAVALVFTDAKGVEHIGTLGNMSTTGAKIAALEDLPALGFRLGDAVRLQVALSPDIQVQAPTIVRFVAGRSMGVEFDPCLADPVLTPLSRWVFRKREEDRERRIRLSSETTEAGPDVRKIRCLLLLTWDYAMEKTLRALLKDLPLMVRVDPDLKALKEALDLNPALVFLHLPDPSKDTRHRLAPLADLLAGHWPFVLLGTNVDNTVLFETGSFMKSSGNYLLTQAPGPFFPRLVQGILRRGATEK
jgi:hypothetical protein